MNSRQSGKPTTFTRREFVRAAGAAAAGFTIVPRHVLAGSGQTPPSDKLNIAGIGVGSQGLNDLENLAPDTNIVALCDVDSRSMQKASGKFPQAKKFVDFRKMFDAMDKEIDAVVVGTPDHVHAVATMSAIVRGKHVYCEKPLAHSIGEVRHLMRAAAKHKVVTQLGNQGHSFGTIRTFCEWIWDGAIGEVKTIDAGCSLVNSGIDELPKLRERPPVPAGLDWDLWEGPAQDRPYNPAYLPGVWRRWAPFGTGTIGDWCCHVVDPVFWALDLGAPATIEATVKDYDCRTQSDTFPKAQSSARRGTVNGGQRTAHPTRAMKYPG